MRIHQDVGYGNAFNRTRPELMPSVLHARGERRRWSAHAERTVFSYFHAFAPAPAWDDLVWWPPDVFALTNLVLDHTEGYRFVIAPPAGRRWPPSGDWNRQVRSAARSWREAVGAKRGELPPLVRRCWDAVSRGRTTALTTIRTGDAWELTEALLTLHATADEACDATTGGRAGEYAFRARAWQHLLEHGSLARLSPARVRVVPKTHLSAHGITIRSLSRHLALCYESVDVRWRTLEPPRGVDRRDYNLVLVPWPLSIGARDFRPAAATAVENMDHDHFGLFEFAPEQPLDLDLVHELLHDARDQVGTVDAVVFPEGVLTPDVIEVVEATLDDHAVTLLVAGVREPPGAGVYGRNYLHFGVRTATGWERYEQDKHHRWYLDDAQLRQYRLTETLDPGKLWWEAIDVRERILHVIDLGHGITTAPLVCEDLARLDEVADLVRRIGPGLVVAVLLDGPQLRTRWPSRYASILADDPGSTVLTLTSYGMAARSCPPGEQPSRVVALWNNSRNGIRELDLAPGSAGILLTASVDTRTLWTADGRRHPGVPGLTLTDVRQLRAGGEG